MGLRDDIQADLAEAFDEEDDLADAVTAFTGSREVAGEYDPTTGTSTTTVTYSGRGVFGSFRQDEIDGQHILRTDIKVTALQNEVLLDTDDSPATPKIDDKINGLKVISVGKDPAGATWSIQLRKT